MVEGERVAGEELEGTGMGVGRSTAAVAMMIA